MSNYRPPHGYGQPPVQDPYQRPGSTTYGQPQATGGASIYTSPPPMNQTSQWAPPQIMQDVPQGQYASPQNVQDGGASVYNPNTYGVMPGRTSQGSPVGPPLPPRHPQPQIPQPYQASQQVYRGQGGALQPPPLGSLPQGYQAEAAQSGQWPQHPPYSQQPPTHRYEPQQSGGYGQDNQDVAVPPYQYPQHQVHYNSTAPPQPLQTPGGSYFSSSGQQGGVGQSHPNQPAGPPPGHPYAPVQVQQTPLAYGEQQSQEPSNRFSYVAPPPPPPKTEIYGAGHSQNQFGNVQGGPFYENGHQQYHQAQGQAQANQPYGQHVHQPQPATAGYQQQQGGYDAPSPHQTPAQPAQHPYAPLQQQHAPLYQPHPTHGSPAQAFTVPPPPPVGAQNAQNPSWPQHQPINAPQPLQAPYANQTQHGHSVSAIHDPYNQAPPLPTRPDEPVSPLFNSRQSISFDRSSAQRQSISGVPSRSESQISRKSIPISAAVSAQEPSFAEQRTTTPEPVAPPRTSTPGVSALGLGGPSDWEHFGHGADEIDDTAMYGTKSPEEDAAHNFASVELPASPVRERDRRSSVDTIEDDGSWRPSPAVVNADVMPAPLQSHGRTPDSVAQTVTPPPHGVYELQHHGNEQQQTPPKAMPQPMLDDPDYIPPMPLTPPPVGGARTNRPIVIGGTAPSQTQAPGLIPHATSIVMDEGGWQQNVQNAPAAQQQEAVTSEPHPQTHVQPHVNPSADGFDMADGTKQPPSQPFAQSTEQTPVYQALQAPNSQSQNQFQSQNGEELMQARRELEEINRRLEAAETALAQRNTEFAQLSSYLEQKVALLNSSKTAMKEMKKKLEAQKQLSLSTDDQLKHAHAEHAALREKLSQAEIGLVEAKQTHDGEKSNLQLKLEESIIALAASKQTYNGEKSDLQQKLDESIIASAAARTASDILKKLLDEALEEAKEKTAAPVDIAPGLDPWFKGSLQRCLDMLELESEPLPVQEKMQVFMDFVNAEARLRGIEMPFGPQGQVLGLKQPPPQQQQRSSSPAPKRDMPPPIQTGPKTSFKGSDDFIFVDSDNEFQYSPGGRPIMKPRSQEAAVPTKQPAREISPTRIMPVELPSGSPPKPEAYRPFRGGEVGTSGTSGSPPVLENLKKAPVVQPPIDKPAYTPFVYNSGEQAAVPLPASQTPISTPTPEPIYKPASATFTQPKKSESKSSTPRESPAAAPRDDPLLPQPLKPKIPGNSTALGKNDIAPKLQRNQSSTASTSLDDLATLLPPVQMPGSVKSEHLQAIRSALTSLPTNYNCAPDLTKKWETQAAVTRSRLENERRKRQAETERRSNELYDDQEINYGDLEDLESQAKEEEMDLKAKEDMEEYESYGREVFEPIFHKLHEQIRALQGIHDNALRLVKGAVAGRQALSLLPDETDLAEAMAFLLQVYDALEQQHAEVANAVKERDRRYKRTQTKPLYARGDIAKMKQVERSFEVSERKNDVKSQVERAERCKRVYKTIEEGMERGISTNEDLAADILTAAESSSPIPSDDLIKRVRGVVEDVYAHTTKLMKVFEKADMQLNECEYDVSVASAKLKGGDRAFFDRLEREKGIEDGKLKEESGKRIQVVGEHLREALGRLDGLKKGDGGGEGEGEEAREERMRRALEEAKRRNGD
ncbi:hypothetical protein EJ08DRAFT_676845 [Tothia fuscella]|uniref:Uncharacterized protein n=1 Tax=Tothia fuscella TaxID=1048955 RepID=A0A9P4NXY5_9PEZI|nr:hypothetical protein EJ08DRAFT_676845 [Tothia fuscella]